MAQNYWHSETPEAVLGFFQTPATGFSAQEVLKQKEKYGPNTLPEAKPDSVFIIFLRQFQSPLIYILIVAAIIIAVLGELADAGIIAFVLVFNAFIGAFQEGKAQNTLASLKKMVETKATVLRNGLEDIVEDKEVVPGDILVLHEGDKIAADARIITSHNLSVDESSLTGESKPVYKTPNVLKSHNLQTAEQTNMIFKGANIVGGSGSAIVVATGTSTIIGSISQEISMIDTEDPLKQGIRKLSNGIIVVVAGICAVLLAAGIAVGNSLQEMFVILVSLSVSVIPEGLPIVLTVVLAAGVWRMSKKNALVKKLQAVESLGQAKIIAVDKTGTITKNELAVTSVYTGERMFNIEANGYEPGGKILFQNQLVSNDSDIQLLAKIATYCANGHVAYSEEKKLWQVSGDPTDAALYVFAQKAGFIKDTLLKQNPLLEEIPFSYQLKYHAVLNQEESNPFLSVTGAPEAVLKLCKITDKEKKDLDEVVAQMSAQGLRVIAAAGKHTKKSVLTTEDVSALNFIGFFGMKDVLRPEAKESLDLAKRAGVRVVMITGDHKLTAQAIAKEAGIFSDGNIVLTGTEVETMNDAELAKALQNVTVFARVTPEHKMRIIQAYKARGEVVAMTGDGVNDAPPLVAADLGVAMGKVGTEVAKEAADIILLDDNFGSIVFAIEEGRNIYKTIKKVILYLFSTGLGEVLTISAAIFLGMPLPLLASQIIWLNFVTDGFLILALAIEPKEPGLMAAKERATSDFVDAASASRMFLMGITMAAGTLLLFWQYLDFGMTKALTMSMTVLAVYQWFNAWNCRSERNSVFTSNPFSNVSLVAATVLVVLLQLLAVYNPFMQKILRTEALSVNDWIVVVAVAFTVVIVEEIRKLFLRLRKA